MSDEVKYLTSRDLLDPKYQGKRRCITLQNLPSNYNEDTIVNYIEVVTKKGLEGICEASNIGKGNVIVAVLDEEITGIRRYIPVSKASGIGQGNVIVAVLDEEITDLSLLKDKPLSGNKITFGYLGKVSGILVLDVGTIKEDTIEMYFDSPKRSGGKEDSVKQVDFHDFGSRIVAVVTIADLEAIENILSRPTHQISSRKLEIEPYFPAFHDVLLDYLKRSKIREQGNKEKDVSEQIQQTKVTNLGCSQTIRSPSGLSSQASCSEITPNRSESTTDILGTHSDEKNKETQHGLPLKPTEIDVSKQEKSKDRQHVIASEIMKMDISKQADLKQGLSPLREKTTAKASPVESKRKNKLMILDDDDDDDDDNEDNDDCPSLKYDPKTALSGPGSGCTSPDVEETVNKAKMRKNANDFKKGRGRKRSSAGSDGCPTDGRIEKKFKEEIHDVSQAKIVLLKIGHFQEKCKQAKLDIDVSLVEKGPSVTLRSNSKADLSQAMLIMKELLYKVVQQSTKVYPKQRAEFVGRQNIQECLRFKAKKEKIGVVFEMKIETMELLCSGFSDEMVSKGIDLFNEAFTKAVIDLREGQQPILQSTEWLDTRTKAQTDAIIIYECDNQIVIEALNTIRWEKIRDIRKLIIDFLKSSTPKSKTVLEISGGQAEYFEKYCRTELENRTRDRQTTFSVKRLKQDRPIKLEVTIEGSSKHVEDAKTKIHNIWHERIDFRRISNDDDDIWQIMRCMDGDIGKDFFRSFQNNSKCIIEVVKDGEVRPPPVKVVERFETSKPPEKVHRNDQAKYQESDSSYDTDDELEEFRQNEEHDDEKHDDEDDNDIDDDIFRPSFEANQLHMYQPKMSEKDALALAMQQSLEESGSFLDQNHDKPTHVYAYQRHYRNTDESRPRGAYGLTHSNSYGNFHEAKKEGQQHTQIVIGNSKVVLMKGSITKLEADVLVNILDPTGEFPGKSTVAKAFDKSAGHALEMPINDSQPPGLRQRFVTVSDRVGNLACRAVFHVKLVKGGQVNEVIRLIPQVMREIYQECGRRGFSSIAIPPLGVGQLYNYPASELSQAMLQETLQSLPNLNTQGINVKFVVHHTDTQTYNTFDNTFRQYGGRHMHHVRSSSQPMLLPQNRGTPRHVHSNPYVHKKDVRQEMRSQTQQGLTASPTPRQGFQRFGRNSDSSNYVAEQQRVLSYEQVDRDAAVGQRRRHHRSDRNSPVRRRPERRHSEERPKRKQYERNYGNRRSGSADRSNQNKHENRGSARNKKAPRESRFSKEDSATKLSITVYAGTKEQCDRLRNDLSKRIKNDFLFEKDLKKVRGISDGAKKKMVRILEQKKVKSVKCNGGYKLKGYKDNVQKANEEILLLLLEDKPKDDHTERKQRRSNMRRATPEFAKLMATEEAEVPEYWKNYHQSGGIDLIKNIIVDVKQFLKNRRYEKEVLDVNGHTYKTILRLINDSFTASSDKIGQGSDARNIQPYTKFFVLEICRIENLELYQHYAIKRSELFRKLCRKNAGYFKKLQSVEGVGHCDPCRTSSLDRQRNLSSDRYEEVNEFFFFHGTKDVNVKKICSDGPDIRLCSPDAMFGQGIYGAESVVKADQYTDDPNSRSNGKGNTKTMFLMRMLMGDMFVCKNKNPHKYKRAPCTTCYKDDCRNDRHQYSFDSVVGHIDNKLFREFVVYESKQCYPEYLITYERR